jgi:hypothetical protein
MIERDLKVVEEGKEMMSVGLRDWNWRKRWSRSGVQVAG